MSQTGATEIIREPAQEALQEQNGGVLQSLVEAISNLILPTNRELITVLRQPSPVKISMVLQADANGLIGGGIDNAQWPVTIYTCPMSAEGWVHRITVWSPEHDPTNPLTAGQVLCTGTTAGEIIFYLPMEPDQTQVAPMQPVIEGRSSAPHLNPGESMMLVAGGIPAGTHLRIDLQINLVTGVSEYTPRVTSPSNLNAPPVTKDIT